MSRTLRRFDWLMFSAIAALLITSCIFIYSADYRNDHAAGGLMVRQIVWAFVGLGCYGAASALDYRKLNSTHWWIYAAGLTALVLVLFVGMSVYGAHRWFKFGGITVQPSEFAKLATMFTMAAWLGNPATDVERFKTFVLAFVLAGVPFLLIAIEPDLGSAMVLLPIVVFLLFCAGVPLRPLLTLIGAGAAALLWKKSTSSS